MKAKVRLLSYREDRVDIGPVKLTVLRLVSDKYVEEPVELGNDPVEVLKRIAIEFGEGSYVEAIGEAKNQIIRVGVPRTNLSSSQSRKMIFYRPSKLLMIGIIGSVGSNGQSIDLTINAGRADPIEGVESGNTADIDQFVRVREPREASDIHWLSPHDDLYVFEGDLNVDASCDAIVIVTDNGEKIHILGASDEGKAAIVKRTRLAVKKKKKKKRRSKRARGS